RWWSTWAGQMRSFPNSGRNYATGNDQEVATIAGYLVFADPANYEARYRQADTQEQLGYQSVSRP
ncbi:MAG: hypothetical protein MJ014_01995, partial [Methanocorpusculum sp.]|nr:hypothetical protein [Methanocorpusculum sp.]